MDNAHGEVVTQDQEPAGRRENWELSREAVQGVSPDPATPVTTQTAINPPVWEIWAVAYAKAPLFFLKTLSIFNATLLSQKPNQPLHWRNAAFNNQSLSKYVQCFSK